MALDLPNVFSQIIAKLAPRKPEPRVNRVRGRSGRVDIPT
jgi:hypothetical protein